MKIPISCFECDRKELERGNKPNLYFDMQNVNDSGIYEYECPNGHENVAVLQNWKYEILFEMGINAFCDEYYREAVVNFAAALERFYEYSIIVFCYAGGISREDFAINWKNVASQSERQIGAFIFLYLQTLKKNPNIFKDKEVKFRNQVVHKGYIPSKEETWKYGKKVAEYIKYNIKIYEENLGDVLEKVKIDFLVDRDENVKKDFIAMGFEPSVYMDFEKVVQNGKRIK